MGIKIVVFKATESDYGHIFSLDPWFLTEKDYALIQILAGAA